MRARVRSSDSYPRERPSCLRLRVDVGALVQEQPHHLEVPILGGDDEAVAAILRVQGRAT